MLKRSKHPLHLRKGYFPWNNLPYYQSDHIPTPRYNQQPTEIMKLLATLGVVLPLLTSTILAIDFAELQYIRGGTLTSDLSVDGIDSYSDLTNTLSYIAETRIPNGTSLTINLDDGTYDCTDSINIDHPDGKRIYIVGNTTTPSSVTLNFAAGKDGITCIDGQTLGLIDGVTLNGDTTSGTPGGIEAVNGSNIYVGSNVVVKEFYVGIFVSHNSTVLCDSVVAQDCDSHGITASYSSYINCANATSKDNGASGITSWGGSVIYAASAIADNNTNSGVYAFQESMIVFTNGTSKNNNSGIRARTGGYVENGGVTYSSNSVNELTDSSGGTIGN